MLPGSKSEDDMTSQKDALLDRFRRQKAEEGTFDRLATLNQWTHDVNELMRMIESWLAGPVQEGLIRVSDTLVELDEPRLGP